MKVTKTSVHRLTIEKTCGCQATREYQDVRYAKPLAEGVFTPCEKHEKNKLVSEFAGEMLLEHDHGAEPWNEHGSGGRNSVLAQTMHVSHFVDVDREHQSGGKAPPVHGPIQAK